MQGSAVHVDMWLLLEYPRPWKPKALQDNDLPDAVNVHMDALTQQALAHGVRLRIQFIKQASSADIKYPRAFLADGREARISLQQTELPSYSEFGNFSLDEIMLGQLPDGHAVEEEIFLVCTNGQRDLCCARFGLPLYEALAFEHAQRVWQTTHVGGHRFAPNLLCLPSGLLYGHVMPDIAQDIVAQHEQGEIALPNLRGRSASPPAKQAAEYFVRERTADTKGALHLDMTGECSFAWHTQVARGQIVLREQALGETLASCGKAPKEEFSFELVKFEIN